MNKIRDDIIEDYKSKLEEYEKALNEQDKRENGGLSSKRSRRTTNDSGKKGK